MMVLLDTSFAVEAIRGNPKTYAQITGVGTLYVSVHVLGELLAGIGPRTPAKLLAATDSFRSQVTVLLPTVRTAERYAEIRRELARVGRQLPQNDTWIAATAMEHGLLLLTFDAHFERVAGLRYTLLK